jgi:hypothetical protein
MCYCSCKILQVYPLCHETRIQLQHILADGNVTGCRLKIPVGLCNQVLSEKYKRVYILFSQNP